jgi:hypothetical protein
VFCLAYTGKGDGAVALAPPERLRQLSVKRDLSVWGRM